MHLQAPLITYAPPAGQGSLAAWERVRGDQRPQGDWVQWVQGQAQSGEPSGRGQPGQNACTAGWEGPGEPGGSPLPT